MISSPSTPTSASVSGTRIPSAGRFKRESEKEVGVSDVPRNPRGGEPEIGVADTEGALLYTRIFDNEGAECRMGGIRREGDGIGIGVPMCEGVLDFALE